MKILEQMIDKTLRTHSKLSYFSYKVGLEKKDSTQDQIFAMKK